jgi:membrane dipeptidase
MMGCGGGEQPKQATDRTAPPETLADRARRVHQQAIVIDTHSDTTSRMLDDGFDFGPRSNKGHMDLVRMKEGGLDAEFFSIYVAARYANKGAARRALDMIEALNKQVAKYPDKVALATSVAEIRRLEREGKIAALMGIEGGHAIEDSPDELRMFYGKGIRYMTLTHSNTNNFADATGVPSRWGGLNDLGRQIVREMNQLGMMVDISHVSDDTFQDVLDVSQAPVIASHSSCRALSPVLRNMSDEMIQALARNGGVIMINFGSGFVNAKHGERANRVLDILRKKHGGDYSHWDDVDRELSESEPLPPATLEDILAHIEHVVKLVGPDYVGLGSDFDGLPDLPQGMEDCTKLPAITYELLKRGYSEQDVTKILGGNLLRVFEAVEQTAMRLQKNAPRS